MDLSDKHLGILGGGQLARMLCDAARHLRLHVRVYAQSAHDSAVLTHPHFDIGRLDSTEGLAAFLKKIDGCIFENEFVDDRLLAREGGAVKFLPPLPVLAHVRDKFEQKKFLEKAGVKAAPYDVRPNHETAARWIERVAERFMKEGVVFKWAQQGYDGKGVFFGTENAESFVDGARASGIHCYAEPRIAFKRELAIVAVRSVTGEFAAYPLVLSEQRAGVCLWVKGPATRFEVSPKLEAEAVTAAKKVAEASGLVGAFALEFFETNEGELLVNEIAPRVHNSGHYSLEASQTSQFENHWRAVLGWELGSTAPKGLFAMRNLLGPAGVSRADVAPPEEIDDLNLYWYGKSETRPGRKLGHVNALATSPMGLQKLVDKMELQARAWEEKCAR